MQCLEVWVAAQVVVECSPTVTLSVRVTSLGLRSAIPMGEGTRRYRQSECRLLFSTSRTEVVDGLAYCSQSELTPRSPNAKPTATSDLSAGHKRRETMQSELAGATGPPLPELAGGSRGLSAPLGTSWGSEVNLTDASHPLELTRPDAIEASLLVGPDEAEGSYSESGGESISLGSDEDEDDDSFSPRTALPMVIGGTGTASLNPAVSMDLHEACKGGCEAEHRVA
ncbi:unnamed protein product [Arctogadus glacialis]